MRKTLLAVAGAWLLWARVQNPPSEPASWMPLNEFTNEKDCNNASVKAVTTIRNARRDSQGLALIAPTEEQNVLLAYFNNRLVGTIVYSCVQFDPASATLALPTSP